MNRIYFIIMAFFCTVFTCHSMDQKIKIGTNQPHQIPVISLLDERLTVKQATELIKKEKEDVNSCSIFFETPLHRAVKRNHKELTNLFIANNAEKDSRDWQGKTPLFYAVKNRNMELIEILLKAEASIEITNNKGETLIDYAEAKEIQLKEVQSKILNKNTSIFELTPKENQLWQKYDNQQKELLFFDKELTPNLVKKCIHEKVVFNFKNLNEKNNPTPLHWAVQRTISSSQLEIIRLLLKNNARSYVLDQKQNTPLDLALKDDNVEIVKVFIECKTDECSSILDSAIQKSAINVVKYLIEKTDCNPNQYLHQAINCDKQEIIQYFFEQTAKPINLMQKSIEKETILHCAVAANRRFAVFNFIKEKIDQLNPQEKSQCINAQSERGHAPGYTALHEAMHKVTFINKDKFVEEVAKWLIDNGADVNIKAKNGNTPLHLAAESNYANCFDLLINAGAKINAINKLNETPLDIALKNENTEFEEKLLKSGAKTYRQLFIAKTIKWSFGVSLLSVVGFLGWKFFSR